MKIIILFIFVAFFASASFAQDQIHNQPPQPQDPPQGWYKQNSTTTQPIGLVSFINRDTGWAGGYYTTNGGNSWQKYPPSVDVIRFLDKNFGYGYSGKGSGWVATTTNGGQSWNDYNTGFSNAGNYFFTTPSRGFCTLFANNIGHSFDGGKTWVNDTIPTGTIDGFASWDSLHVICSGHHYLNPDPPHNFGIATVFRTSDGGQTWKFATQERLTTAAFQPVVQFDTATVYFIAEINGVFKSINQGYTFAHVSIPFGNTDGPYGACASDHNNIIVVGSSGLIFRTFNGGSTWEKQISGTINDLFAVSFVDSSTGWAVGDGGTILHTTNAGYSWVKQQIPQHLKVSASPEPFMTKTTLSYSIPKAAKVEVTVYDMTGRQVSHISSDGIQGEGQHSIELSGAGLSAGVYYFILIAGAFNGMGKITKIVP